MSETKNTAEQKAPETKEQKAPEVAENEDTKPETNADEERVDVFVPRAGDGTGDPNLQVTVNGVCFLLPRGKTSSVPKYVYEEIQRSYRAQERYDELVAAQKAKANLA